MAQFPEYSKNARFDQKYEKMPQNVLVGLFLNFFSQKLWKDMGALESVRNLAIVLEINAVGPILLENFMLIWYKNYVN